MFRLLYAGLLRLHPRAFRERFSEEMMDIFDEETQMGARFALVADGLVSLGRQWVVRPARHAPASSIADPVRASDVPVFHLFESDRPRQSALVNGAVVSLVLFIVVSSGIGRGGGGGSFPRVLAGAKHPRPLVLPVDRSSLAELEPTTEVKVKAASADPLHQLASSYFSMIRVLDVLDLNRDRVISEWEIVTASSALARLDVNGDGRLTAKECGFDSRFKRETPFVGRAQLEFMRKNPVLAALGADGNGEISRVEIQNSANALRLLDRNRDGSLTPSEVLPD